MVVSELTIGLLLIRVFEGPPLGHESLKEDICVLSIEASRLNDLT